MIKQFSKHNANPATSAASARRRVPLGKSRRQVAWYKRKRVTLPLLFLAAVFVTIGVLWWFTPAMNPITGEMERRGDRIMRATSNLMDPKRSLETSFSGQRQISVIILGLDHVPATTGDPGKIRRCDSVLVAKTDFDTKQVRILSIPRDGWVKHWQDGKGFGYDRVGHTYSFGQEYNLAHSREMNPGGVSRSVETIEHLLDMDLDFHVVIQFEGVVEIIDLLCPDGLEIDVEKDMKYSDKAGDLYIDLKKGVQRLNGEELLGYARYRSDALGDIGRMSRQQKVLKLLLAEAMKPQNLPKLPGIAQKMCDPQTFSTNLNLDQLIALAQHLDEYDPAGIKTKSLYSEYNLERGREQDIPGLTITEARERGLHVQGIFEPSIKEAEEFIADLKAPEVENPPSEPGGDVSAIPPG